MEKYNDKKPLLSNIELSNYSDKETEESQHEESEQIESPPKEQLKRKISIEDNIHKKWITKLKEYLEETKQIIGEIEFIYQNKETIDNETENQLKNLINKVLFRKYYIKNTVDTKEEKTLSKETIEKLNETFENLDKRLQKSGLKLERNKNNEVKYQIYNKKTK